MNYDAIMDRIDKFFENVSPDEIIQSLEKKGYAFEELCSPELTSGSYVTSRPKDIGNKGEYLSSKKYGASNTCSFFLYLN